MRLWMTLTSVALLTLAGCDRQPSAPAGESAAPATTARAPDLDRGKVLAEPCAACHGENGNLSVDGSPFLAGQQQDYLYAAMQEYRDGTRKHDGMRKMVGPLKPFDLLSVAAYYGSQTADWKGEGVAVSAPAKPAVFVPDWGAISAGRKAAAACSGCHGVDGRSSRGDVPSLAGLPPDYFVSATRAYFTGARHDEYMAYFRQALSARDLSNLGAYYFFSEPRRVNAPVSGNAAAGKAKSTACAGCHGADGNSLNINFPSLTGQGEAYLVKATKEYRDGRRRNSLMRNAVRGLSNRDILDLAAFYARQTPVRIGSRVRKAGNTPLEQGAQLAASCDGCHGTAGNSRTPGTPSLTGLSVHYLYKATRDYRDGRRKHDLMRGMVETLTDLDIEKVAFHYAMQEPELIKKRSPGNAAEGAKIAASCDGCHGPQGNSKDPKTPTLAGQDATFMATVLAEYASGARPEGVMQSPAAALSAQDIENVAAYYSERMPEKFPTRAPETAQAIAERCDRCHGDAIRATQPDKPRLAGQVEGYLLKALNEYRSGVRKHSAMKSMSDGLSLVEVTALSKHYAGQ